MERTIDLNFHHQIVVFLSEVLNRYEVCDRCIIHQDINRPIGIFSFFDQVDPVFRHRQIGPDSRCVATGIPNPSNHRIDATRQYMVAIFHRSRRNNDPGSLHGIPYGDRFTYSTAGASDDSHFPCQ